MRFGIALVVLALAGCESVQTSLNDLSDRFDTLLAGEARIYDEMRDSDIVLAAQTMQHALETRRHGEPVRWINDETGNTGAVTPQRTFVTDRGVFCREYAEHLKIFGEEAVLENTACRTEAGQWAWLG